MVSQAPGLQGDAGAWNVAPKGSRAGVVRLLALLKGVSVSKAISTGCFAGSQAGHGLNHETTAFFNLFHDHVGSRIAHVRQCE